jgi:hypothetical protein
VAPTSRNSPQEGNAAPVADAPTGPFYDGSHAGMRGVNPEGYEHGANYGGYTATGFNSSTTTRLPPGRSICIRRYGGRPRGHQPMGTRTAVLAPTPEAKAFGCPLTAEREPVLARPQTNRGHHGEDGASLCGLDSCASNVVRVPSSAVLSG